jgi:hypothetical protein
MISHQDIIPHQKETTHQVRIPQGTATSCTPCLPSKKATKGSKRIHGDHRRLQVKSYMT